MAPPPPTAPASRRVSRRRVLGSGLALVVVAAAGGTGAYFYLNRKNTAPLTPVSTTVPNPAGTIIINFTYSSEKAAWMQAVMNSFQQSGVTANGKTIQVVLDERGSVDALNKILDGTLQPTAWSPASFLELNQLSAGWQQKHPSQDIFISTGDLLPQSLVSSPLVFAVWKDRAQVLQSKYGTIDWSAIHDALTQKNGWAAIGGQANWGLVKFGQTRPDQSNSGLLTITLMAYAVFQEQRGLTLAQVDAPKFLQYFNDVEGAVSAFGRSSGTFLENIVIPDGPASYDIITTYENLLLAYQPEAQQRQQQPLQLFYPSLNILSDHPFAILQGNWVTPEQRTAAQVFRNFLLAEPQQRLALASGFRPANPNVPLTTNVPNNPFQGQQVMPQIQPLAQDPSGAVVNELIHQWQTSYSTAALANG